MKSKLPFLYRPIAIFIAVVFWWICFFYLDKPVAEFFHARPLPYLHFVDELGKGWVYIGLFAILACFFWIYARGSIWRARCTFLVLILTLPYLLTGLSKVLLGRARPQLWFNEHLFGFFGFQSNKLYWSFPSGHTTVFIALALGFSTLFPKYRVHFIGLGCLLSLTRVFLTFHYLSDVLGTIYLVGFEYVLMMTYLNFFRKERA